MTEIDGKNSSPSGDIVYQPMSEDIKRSGPEPVWEALREREPVHHFVLPVELVDVVSSNPLAAARTEEFWSVLRYDDVLYVLSNAQLFSSRNGTGPEWISPEAMGEAMLILADDPDHLRQRRLAAKAFTPRSVERLLPRIQAITDELIDACVERGTMEIAADFSLPLSIRTIAGIMGVPEERGPDFLRWGTAITAAFGGDTAHLEAGFVGLTELAAYTQTLIDAVRDGEPERICPSLDGGVLAAMVRAEDEGKRLTDGEINSACMQLITAGFETTSTAIANGVHALCTHPDQRKILENDPGMVPTVVEEILRYMSPLEAIFRTTTRNVRIGECRVPAERKVRPLYASANRDPSKFSDPGSFRVDREPAELKNHIAFGKGPHACIGAALARAELRIAIGTLFERLPGLELHPDRPSERNTALQINGFREVTIRWDPARVERARRARQ